MRSTFPSLVSRSPLPLVVVFLLALTGWVRAQLFGPVEIIPADLLGREAQAVFQAEEREDPLSGRRVMRLRVPYAGFAPLDGSPSVDSELDAALRKAPSASSGGAPSNAPSMPRGLAGPWDDASSESPGGGALGNGVARSIADDDED